MKRNTAYLLIGGNLGDREHYLATARELIQEQCGEIIQQSSIYETAAWGLENQAAFLNQALRLETLFTAEELLPALLQIEASIGRHREIKYGPRTIDIDILLFNDDVMNESHLQIPHSQLQNRRFVLVPLAEIAAGVIHPVLQKTIQQLLEAGTDQLAVNKI